MSTTRLRVSAPDVTIDDVRSLVCLQLGRSRVDADADLVSDLGAESADVVNLIAALEDKYGVVVGEEELPDLKTVRDLFERVAAPEATRPTRRSAHLR